MEEEQCPVGACLNQNRAAGDLDDLKDSSMVKVNMSYFYFCFVNELEEKIEMGDETDSDENEDINEDEPFYPSYIVEALALVDETKDEIEKMRKNTREAKVKVEKLCLELTSLPLRCEMTPIGSYLDPIEKLEEFMKSNEMKMDKDTCLTKLVDLKKQLQKITC